MLVAAARGHAGCVLSSKCREWGSLWVGTRHLSAAANAAQERAYVAVAARDDFWTAPAVARDSRSSGNMAPDITITHRLGKTAAGVGPGPAVDGGVDGHADGTTPGLLWQRPHRAPVPACASAGACETACRCRQHGRISASLKPRPALGCEPLNHFCRAAACRKSPAIATALPAGCRPGR